MIYSKFGSKLTPISKHEDASGQITVQATAEGSPEIREYHIGDFKADEGSPEIEKMIATLPRKKAVETKAQRRQDKFR